MKYKRYKNRLLDAMEQSRPELGGRVSLKTNITRKALRERYHSQVL